MQPVRGEKEMEEEKITDSSTLFAAAVRPILKSKCFSCHNEKKAKGGLVMTTEEKLLTGGKNGPVWKPGNALNSHIIQNINLPEEEKKHMPPKDKPQLSREEAELIFAWIQAGADMKKTIKDYAEGDTIRSLAARFVHLPKENEEKKYLFAAADVSTIRQLNGPFCSVFPLSQNSQALQADFFVKEKFDRKKLEELLKVKEQLVVLNLDNMPVTDDDMKMIYQFSNLEKLLLNNSLITNNGLKEMGKLKKLQSLSLSGTMIDKNTATWFSQADSLKEVFVWNTKISAADAAELQKQNGKINFNTGYVPDEKEILVLTPPLVKNDEFILNEQEKIILKHQVPGVIIRYSLDGTEPDSISAAEYKEPITVNGFTTLKTRAAKTGWYSSPVLSFSFFKKGAKPSSAELINAPNEKYKGEGPATLIDSKKGLAESFNDAAWLGFREKPFEAFFYFDTVKTISSISISYNENVQSYLLPPEYVEVWAGDEKNKLKFIKKTTPLQPTEKEKNVVRNGGIKIDFPPSTFKVYKIVAKNVSKLPKWHPGKGDKAWVFIDEIFFN